MKFAPNEIAIAVGMTEEWERFNGSELTVIRFSQLESRINAENTYIVEASWLQRSTGYKGRWCLVESHLRKRPPKQQWDSLLRLKDKPRELEPA
jgi:hypothetical protein